VLVSAAMGLVVLGLQQAAVWGWQDGRTWACIAAGLVLLAAFVSYQPRASEPLIQLRMFAQRARERSSRRSRSTSPSRRERWCS
jgi:hypothetical protein